MRQTSATEKVDPLMRIQEEIKEVKRREQEYRQLKSVTSADSSDEYIEHNGNTNDNNNEHLSMSPVPPMTAATPHMVAVVTSLALPVDDSSLASSVNSKESLDEHHHSDDSGISASSSPVNGTSANGTKVAVIKDKRYIGPNTYYMTPVPPPQKLLTRATSTPQIFTQHRIIAHSSAQKGLMQRFIASRGKIVLSNNGAGGNKLILNNNTNYNNYSSNNSKNVDLSNGNLNGTHADADAVIAAALNTALLTPDFTARNGAAVNIPTDTMTPPIIERDAEGKPIRRGYIPVEVKIQRELKDYKSRESELKKNRKIRESTPDLLDSIAMENTESDEDDSEVEHCYGPGKLRSAKSIGELCDSAQSNNSISPSNTPSPDYELRSIKLNFTRSNGMRPAMSLAQLCDLPPEDAPSSHRLIAQWENIIKQHEIKTDRE